MSRFCLKCGKAFSSHNVCQKFCLNPCKPIRKPKNIKEVNDLWVKNNKVFRKRNKEVDRRFLNFQTYY